MPLLGAVLSFLVFVLLCVLVLLVIEWVAGLFGVPANIMQVVRAIFGLMVLIYLLALLFGSAETITLPLFRGH